MVLDVSKSVHKDGGSFHEDGDLMVALSKLPCLESLDVSCRQVSARDLQLFDPPHHHMLFLGLVNSPLCGHPDINSNLACIGGDHNESQLLLGLELYKERHDYMKLILFELANFQPPVIEIDRGTQALLEVCDTYPKERHILLLAIASLYLYTKCDEMSTDIKRKAIWMLVDIMSKHLDYGELMQNCCICLYPYQTMEDSGFVLTKLAMVLVHLVDGANSLRTLLMALLALSKLIWWLPKPKKIWLASLGTIEITLEVLMGLNSVDPQGLQENPLDLMEAGWNILWNMTDECPENCVQFCANSGIEVTMACYQSHRQAFEDAMPSIFGALGNVVEVDGLQNKVMKQEVIEALREAITTDKHHRMSYSIGGIIANLAYNGDEFWGDVQPSRQSMLEFMVEEMQQWDLEGEIWIEFNSLRPLMKIVRSCEDKVAYWAIMTIAGLSTIRQERYCNLLHKENVITVFKEISSRTGDTSLSPSVPRLATVIVENYESFFNSQQLMDIS
ncbi:zyg eleven-related protein 1-like isoform X2 [Dysidea avara]|uniref:zyg eleven-related protein 1-like isoform X2 n=3 Tax=Dysidea avara TaxID=196820 RepID=UPI0033262D1C